MSQRALALAVRDTIRTSLSLTDSPLVCEVMFDGQPNPGCGEWFYAVHPGPWAPGPHGDSDLDEVFTIFVTVTRRLGFAPTDRFGPEVWAKAVTGLDVTLRKIVVAIHKSEAVRLAANTYIDAELDSGVTQSGFYHHLQFANGGVPTPKGADWFCADSERGPGKFANAGVSQQLTFDRAQRCQHTVGMG